MSAVISPCGLYRYRLERTVAMEGPVFAFFGINPSTADANVDDATVRKWIGFAKRWGASRFIVGNVFAYRATDVRDLCNDPRSLDSVENREHVARIAAEADILVPCWGSRGKVLPQHRHHLANAMARLLTAGKPVMHFGLTASVDPKHPLMLGYDTPLIPWGDKP